MVIGMKECKWLLLEDQEDGVKQFEILGEVGQLYLTVSNPKIRTNGGQKTSLTGGLLKDDRGVWTLT